MERSGLQVKTAEASGGNTTGKMENPFAEKCLLPDRLLSVYFHRIGGHDGYRGHLTGQL